MSRNDMLRINHSIDIYKDCSMRRRNFWIYLIIFFFISGGLIVALHHQHPSEALYDVSDLQVYCHHVKNPISRNSIQCLVSVLLITTIICLHLIEKRRTVCNVNLYPFKKCSLIFHSTYSYRAPPKK